MRRRTFAAIALCAVLVTPAARAAEVSCTRDGLQRAVDLYIAAQTKGDTSGLPLAIGLGITRTRPPPISTTA